MPTKLPEELVDPLFAVSDMFPVVVVIAALMVIPIPTVNAMSEAPVLTAAFTANVSIPATDTPDNSE